SLIRDGSDRSEVDAAAAEAVGRDADSFAGVDDGGAVGPGDGVGAVGLDALPVDDAEAPGLLLGSCVLHAADARLERVQRRGCGSRAGAGERAGGGRWWRTERRVTDDDRG